MLCTVVRVKSHHFFEPLLTCGPPSWGWQLHRCTLWPAQPPNRFVPLFCLVTTVICTTTTSCQMCCYAETCLQCSIERRDAYCRSWPVTMTQYCRNCSSQHCNFCSVCLHVLNVFFNALCFTFHPVPPRIAFIYTFHSQGSSFCESICTLLASNL